MSVAFDEIEHKNQIKNLISVPEFNLASVLETPSLYMSRQNFTKMLTRIELFKKIINVQGSIVECGTYKADSLLTFFHMSTILEPFSFTRKIIGFDTFTGFPTKSDKDNYQFALEGHLSDVDLSHIKKVVEIQELNKAVPEIRKIELVEGNASESIPQYVGDNPHLIISLLYLDFDLYEPTKIALEQLLPRVVRGGIVAFDELNQLKWKGETQALHEVIGIGNVALRKFSFDGHVSYYRIE